LIVFIFGDQAGRHFAASPWVWSLDSSKNHMLKRYGTSKINMTTPDNVKFMPIGSGTGGRWGWLGGKIRVTMSYLEDGDGA
jgi:hypothetical protein